MLRYLAYRALISLLALWILATASFFLLRALPGSPFQTEIPIPPEIEAHLSHYYGLDRPLLAQYATYLDRLLHGDMGYSLKYANRSVNGIIAEAFPVSAALGLTAIGFAVPVGIVFGVVSARLRGQAVDYGLVALAVLGMSVPSFIVGAMLQYWFGVRLRWLPVAEWGSPAHVVLPAFALGLTMIASLTRTMRASMLEVVEQEFVKTARMKGLSEWQIVFRHELRNALIPIVTHLGPLVAFTVTGSFVIEQLFAIPGLGRYFVMSVTSLDYTTAMGLTVFLGALVIAFNLLVDLAYTLVDPRIQIAR